jgi:hypothetical protein
MVAKAKPRVASTPPRYERPVPIFCLPLVLLTLGTMGCI